MTNDNRKEHDMTTLSRTPRLTLTRGRLTWTCEVCDEPIANNAGYVTANYAEFGAHQDWHREFDERKRREAEAEGKRFVGFRLSELDDSPPRARWRALHQGCDPDVGSTDYWIGVERCRTLPELIHWTAHLMGKNWIGSTDWDKLLYEVGKYA
jgi:hypothetical protein